jgi:YggT family protein
MLTIFFNVLFFAIQIYTWAIFLAVIYSMLAMFGVLDTRNRMVWQVGEFLNRVTEPVLRPVRQFMPNLGNIDISPMVVLALIQLVVVPSLQRLQIAITTGAWQALVF